LYDMKFKGFTIDYVIAICDDSGMQRTKLKMMHRYTACPIDRSINRQINPWSTSRLIQRTIRHPQDL